MYIHNFINFVFVCYLTLCILMYIFSSYVHVILYCVYLDSLPYLAMIIVLYSTVEYIINYFVVQYIYLAWVIIVRMYVCMYFL